VYCIIVLTVKVVRAYNVQLSGVTKTKEK